MKRIFGLLIVIMSLVLVGCSQNDEASVKLTEKEKLVTYLKRIGYECNDVSCNTTSDNVKTLFLPSNTYDINEGSSINLVYGFIKEDLSFSENESLSKDTSVTTIKWNVEYTITTGEYEVNYHYYEKTEIGKVDIAYGTKRNNSFISQSFLPEYLEVNPDLTSENMQRHADERYDNLINNWDKIFELSGIDKEKLIEEFKERN